MLGYHPPIKYDADSPPQLLVVIDTEEEFDWDSPPNPESTSVTAMDYIVRAQEIFDDYGIKPCYVIDYPVVSQELGYRVLKSIYEADKCEIGAHLHPWVSPPVSEEMTAKNTFPGNLPRDLEFAKLKNLKEKIEEVFGFSPTIYKAGRYGVGENTPAILEELGFNIDLSLCPPIDYSGECGPDFSSCHAEPFWFGSENNILEIPVTGSFVGWAGKKSKGIFNFAKRHEKFRLPGIFAKTSMVDRLVLSPEGYTPKEHIKLTDSLISKGVRTFTWSFHSPSVVPGHTSYVRNDDELRFFLDSFRHYFDYFFGELKGVATSPLQMRQALTGVKK